MALTWLPAALQHRASSGLRLASHRARVTGPVTEGGDLNLALLRPDSAPPSTVPPTAPGNPCAAAAGAGLQLPPCHGPWAPELHSPQDTVRLGSRSSTQSAALACEKDGSPEGPSRVPAACSTAFTPSPLDLILKNFGCLCALGRGLETETSPRCSLVLPGTGGHNRLLNACASGVARDQNGGSPADGLLAPESPLLPLMSHLPIHEEATVGVRVHLAPRLC
ncbi:uncharacterized protein LOC124975370 [Sciurus carolinensis]|uniref:uncharacterized protein LOC124975370 n=1 Tax=Sciurus carolinensis TaxID=30640 RepID=UPI001FB366C7|nr:uncharacterized protein LOC124975370 [Sciurus carolinensis]